MSTKRNRARAATLSAAAATKAVQPGFTAVPADNQVYFPTRSPKTVAAQQSKRRCLSCGEPDVSGLCAACSVEQVLDRLADVIAEEAETIRELYGSGVNPLPVREHLRPQVRRQPSSRPELDVAIEWTRKPDRNPDGWCWGATYAIPAPHAEAFSTGGSA
jgi:hypothetical protein